MNYKIIQDEELLREFIDWLPELSKNETYYVSLIARKKYDSRVSPVKSDKAQLKRFTSNKERLFEKIKQLEVELGAYTQKGITVSQESLALYITPNPRSFIKATKNSLMKFAQLICDGVDGYNPHQEVMSEIQKAKSYTKWIDFDLDINDADMMTMQLSEKMIIDAVKKICGLKQPIVKTRGGYHVLVDPSSIPQEKKNTFYNGMQNEPIWSQYLDISGDNLLPVVGCTQGGFTPYFLVK